MANFVIQPTSVSYAEIRQDLITYFNSLPDAESWSIFLASGAGSRIIDLLAAMSSFCKFETITARREAFIQFAKNRSSIVGKAQDFGYSSYRGRNKIIKVTFTPATTGLLFKYTYLGSVKDKFLILDRNTVVNAGVPIQVTCIIGEVLTETKNATGSILDSFRFSQPDVSEDLRVYIDSNEIAWGSDINDALNGKFQIQSNTFRSVDAKYLNLVTFPIQYNVGSEIKLEYVKLKDLSYVNSDIKYYEAFGVFTAIEDVSLFADVESDDSVRINAPIKNEVSRAVRGREDQPRIYRSLNPNILDAKGIDITDAIMKIFLLRSSGLTFSQSEITAMQTEFEKYRPNGLLKPIIENALPSNIKLKIVLTLKSSSTTVPSVLVTNVLLPYANILGTSILLTDIENALEEDTGVKIARVSIKADIWSSLKNYKLGDYIEPTIENGFVYRILGIKSKSNSVEPTWPLIANATVVDNQIVWKAIPKNDLAGINTWQANFVYYAGDIFNVGLGNLVKPTVANGFIYEAVKVNYNSGVTEPVWSATNGAKFEDGRLLWVATTLIGTPSAWSASTAYSVGDIVKATTGLLTTMFQVVGYLDKSSNTEPTWPVISATSVDENNLVWQAQSKTQEKHAVEKNQYFVVSNELTVN